MPRDGVLVEAWDARGFCHEFDVDTLESFKEYLKLGRDPYYGRNVDFWLVNTNGWSVNPVFIQSWRIMEDN